MAETKLMFIIKMNLLIITVMIISSTAEIKHPISRSDSNIVNEDLISGTIKKSKVTVINGADGSQEVRTVSKTNYNNSRDINYSQIDDFRSYMKNHILNHTLLWESNFYKNYRVVHEFERYIADDSSIFTRDFNQLYNYTGVYTSIVKKSVSNNGARSTNYVRENKINGTVYVIQNTTTYGDGSSVDHLQLKKN